MKFEELKELSRRLQALLDDPQPGLYSWNMLLNEVMTKLARGWMGEDK